MGWKESQLKVEGVEELGEEALEVLKGTAPRYRPPTVKRLRDSHHMMARLFACGMSCGQVAALSGYSYNRVTSYSADPSFRELVEQYRKDPGLVEQTWGPLEALASMQVQIAIKGARAVLDHFEEAEESGEIVPLRLAQIAAADAADRIGLGKRSTVTHNVDFAARLDEAIRRSERARVVEGELGE